MKRNITIVEPPRKKHSFLIGFLLIFIGIPTLIAFFIEVCVTFDKFKDIPSDGNTGTESSSAAAVADEPEEEFVLGEKTIELHEISPVEEQCLTLEADKGYTYSGDSWDGAFLFRAGNGENTAFAVYDIEGKFEKITLKATPYLGDGVFFEDSTADIVIMNEETNEIISTVPINYYSGVINAEADISGVSRLGIYVNKTSSGLGDLAYTFIMDVYLYPKE